MADNITVFAQTNYRNELKKFGIKTDDRRRNMYLIGKTGMGKARQCSPSQPAIFTPSLFTCLLWI